MAIVAPDIQTNGPQFMWRETDRPAILRGLNAPQYTPFVKQIGSNFVRLRYHWQDFEPKPGTFTFDRIGRDIEAYRNDGVQVLIDVHGVRGNSYPSWFTMRKAKFWQSAKAFATYRTPLQRLAKFVGQFSNVIGIEPWNEPRRGIATTQTMLHRMGEAASWIRSVDPNRATVIQLRSGWDFGLMTGDFANLGSTKHMVLDLHDQYCGCVDGSGYSSDGERAATSTGSTSALVNKYIWPYAGTLESQRAHLEYAIDYWVKKANRPLLIGEWSVRADDPNATVYQDQMLQLFSEYKLSWARWRGTGIARLDGPALDQLQQALATPIS